MSKSRGIKVIAVLAFIGLFASGISYAEPIEVGCKDCYEGKVAPSNPYGVGGDWGINSMGPASSVTTTSPDVGCRVCYEGKVAPSNPYGVGGDWGTNSAKLTLDTDRNSAGAESCSITLTAGRNGDKGC